uniref:Uncharacterized protein n=1 Tax=Knipowitschia caucasica TaxID=637954 RepID=A0AAV2MAC2_KNICA
MQLVLGEQEQSEAGGWVQPAAVQTPPTHSLLELEVAQLSVSNRSFIQETASCSRTLSAHRLESGRSCGGSSRSGVGSNVWKSLKGSEADNEGDGQNVQ